MEKGLSGRSQEHHTDGEAWGWEHHDLQCFSETGTGALHVIEEDMN